MLENLYPHLARLHGIFGWLLLVIALAAIVIAFSG
jgi:hypothetical protein